MNLKKKNRTNNSFLSLELYEFSNIVLDGMEYPILVHIKDIKWFDFSYTIQEEDQAYQEVLEYLSRNILEKGIDRIMDCILWEASGLELTDKVFYELNSQAMEAEEVNYVNLERERKLALERVKFNMKMKLLYDTYSNSRLKDEIMELNEYIYGIQERLIADFNDIIESEDFMRTMRTDDTHFKNMIQMFAKTGIGRMGGTPFFPENKGRAFSDYSFREIKLRMLFENKEYALNFKSMELMRNIRL